MEEEVGCSVEVCWSEAVKREDATHMARCRVSRSADRPRKGKVDRQSADHSVCAACFPMLLIEPKLSQPVSRNTANKDARTGCLQVRRLVLRVRFPKKPSALGGHRPWSFLGSSEVIGFSSSRGSHAVF